MHRKKWIFGLILILAIGLERLYFLQHGGFALSKVISHLDDAQTDPYYTPPRNVSALLDQPFHFIGSGGTCFVFLGKDQETVLKLFKHQHLLPRSLFFHLPLFPHFEPWRLKKISEKERRHRHKRLPFLFQSLLIAEKELKEETGILHLCLKKDLSLTQTIRLIDKWGITHKLRLAETEFVLQKKGTLLFPFFEEHLRHQRLTECKQGIDSLLSLIAQRTLKGIADRDPHLRINFGFVDGKAIELDIGSFFPAASPPTPQSVKSELFFCTAELQKWLEKQSPELLDYIREQIIHYKTPI